MAEPYSRQESKDFSLRGYEKSDTTKCPLCEKGAFCCVQERVSCTSIGRIMSKGEKMAKKGEKIFAKTFSKTCRNGLIFSIIPHWNKEVNAVIMRKM